MIELKFPSMNKGFTNAVNKFKEDIEFVEFIKKYCCNFKNTYCINISRHKWLYSGGKMDISMQESRIKWLSVPNKYKQCVEFEDFDPKYYIYKNI